MVQNKKSCNIQASNWTSHCKHHHPTHCTLVTSPLNHASNLRVSSGTSQLRYPLVSSRHSKPTEIKQCCPADQDQARRGLAGQNKRVGRPDACSINLLFALVCQQTFSMPLINQKRQQAPLSLTTLSCVGLSGVVAVTAQTLSLSWINNLVNMQAASGLSTFEMLKRIVTSKEAKVLYKGEMVRFRYASLARFGDLVSNYAVIRFFENHAFADVRATPIFLQTAFSWIIASAWRTSLLPLDLLHRRTIWARPSFHRLMAKLDLAKVKRWKMDIVPLYSWLAVQNYLMAYTQPLEYSSDRRAATARNSAIGFASMSAYEVYRCCKQLWRNWEKTNMRRHRQQICLKGTHGVVFCNVTQLVKQIFQVGKP